ncbi:MAG: molybdopterin-synthase adenylyltransferase MoeB [Nitrososphaerota archaeon]|nr:molybdopterin-synthase adenylyltransferase MoeB [Nitrososphaerota archaeon]
MIQSQKAEGLLPPLSNEEKTRYSRHIIMPEVGMDGQRRLKASSVVIVGAGGLGNPAAAYLASAGVGTLGIVDDDVVEVSNLQRQVLFSEADIGRRKAEVLRSRLQSINPHVRVNLHQTRLTSANAMDVLRPYDIVLDASDNFPTRYLINDACVLLKKPDVYGSVFRFDGQVSVFSMADGPCYRCLYPAPPPSESVQSCSEAGVLGVLTGIIGAVQANQVISMLIGKGATLAGRLMLFDGLDSSFDELRIRRDPQCPVCGPRPTVTRLIDYEEFCGVRRAAEIEGDLDPAALKAEMDGGASPFLLDVREPYEYQFCHLEGAKLIPLGQLQSRMNEVDRKASVVVYCHTGVRSSFAAKVLKEAGFTDVRNLTGGIESWAQHVDRTMPRY